MEKNIFFSLYTTGCHRLVDPEPFYLDCVYDVCACDNDNIDDLFGLTKASNCLCPVLAHYATACANKGLPIEWRKNVVECGEKNLFRALKSLLKYYMFSYEMSIGSTL